MKKYIILVPIIVIGLLILTARSNYSVIDNTPAWDEAHRGVTVVTDDTSPYGCIMVMARINSGLVPDVRCK